MKRTTDNEWAHLVCALWIPDVHIADPDTMEPIINQTKRKNNSVF